jgi:hypothetical protein
MLSRVTFDYAAPQVAYEAHSAYFDTGSLTDPSYLLCQPYTRLPTYSPTICPAEKTMDRVTEIFAESE